jgi:hypothetical protein
MSNELRDKIRKIIGKARLNSIANRDPNMKFQELVGVDEYTDEILALLPSLKGCVKVGKCPNEYCDNG